MSPRVLIQLINMREIAVSGLVFTRQMIPRLVAELGPERVTLLADGVARRHLPNLSCQWDLHAVPDARLAKNLALRRLLPEAVERHRPDVIYVPEGPLIGARVQVPVVSTVHSHLNFSQPEGMWLPRRLYWMAWANRAYRRDAGRSAVLLAPTSAFAAEYSRWCPEAAGRIEVVAHGVAPAFHPRPAGATDAHPSVLFVGNDMDYKNLAGALRIHARVAPDVPHELRVAGVDAAALGRIAKRAGEGVAAVLPRVRALGRLDEAALAEEYRRASALLFPSLCESFGLPVLEAMAAGVPVACSSLDSLREVAGGAAEHADPRDVIAFASALRGILLWPGRARRMAERGLERARAFTWERAAEQTARVLREAAASGVRAAS